MKYNIIKELFIMEVFALSVWTFIDALIEKYKLSTNKRIIVSFIFVVILTMYIYRYL